MLTTQLQTWEVDATGRRIGRAALRQYERAVDAVWHAWQGRPATLSERGVLTVPLPSGRRLRARVKSDGVWLREGALRALKELLTGQREFPAMGDDRPSVNRR